MVDFYPDENHIRFLRLKNYAGFAQAARRAGCTKDYHILAFYMLILDMKDRRGGADATIMQNDVLFALRQGVAPVYILAQILRYLQPIYDERCTTKGDLNEQ